MTSVSDLDDRLISGETVAFSATLVPDGAQPAGVVVSAVVVVVIDG